MKTVEEIYQRTLASSDPKYYKDIKRELMSEIGDDYEKLKAYKMVCEDETNVRRPLGRLF